MSKLGKKIKILTIIILLQIFLTSCQTKAEVISLENIEVLFKKSINVDNKHHQLIISKSEKINKKIDLCDIEEICNDATLDIAYTLNGKAEWKHNYSVENCSYDITLNIFENDLIFSIENNLANILIGYESLCSSSFDPTIVKVVGYKNGSEYVLNSDTKNTYNKYNEFRIFFEKISRKRKTYFLDEKNSSLSEENNVTKNWRGHFTFNVNDIQHMGESHDFSQTIILDESSCMINMEVNNEKLDSEECFIKSSTKKEIHIKTSDNKDYKLEREDDGNFIISGIPVYMINPPTESYPLILK